MLEKIKNSNKPIYTVFIPFTRLWHVDAFLERLSLILPPERCSEIELVFFNDTNIPELHDKLYVYLKKYENDFNGALLWTSGEPLLGEQDLITRRRDRIVKMKTKSKELIGDSKYVFGLEDDTIAPYHAFTSLLGLIQSADDIAIVSGVQMGRWATPMIGAWHIKPLFEPIDVKTAVYKSTGLEEVDGVGWYCYLTPTKLYKEAVYHYEADCLGPDVCYAWDLRRLGYRVIVDWKLVCAHITQYGIFIPNETNTQQAKFARQDDNRWLPMHHVKIRL